MTTPNFGLALPSEDCDIPHEFSMLEMAQGLAESAWDDEEYLGQAIVTQMWGASEFSDEYSNEEDAWFSDEKTFDEIMAGLWVYEYTQALAYAGHMTVNESGNIVPSNADDVNAFWGVIFVDESGCYALGPAYEAPTELFMGSCPMVDTMFARLRGARKLTQWRRAAAMIHVMMNDPHSDKSQVVENFILYLKQCDDFGQAFDDAINILATLFDHRAEAAALQGQQKFDRAEEAEVWFLNSLTEYNYQDVRENVLAHAFQPRALAVFDKFINAND